jgi:hypothetical protein
MICECRQWLKRRNRCDRPISIEDDSDNRRFVGMYANNGGCEFLILLTNLLRVLMSLNCFCQCGVEGSNAYTAHGNAWCEVS